MCFDDSFVWKQTLVFRRGRSSLPRYVRFSPFSPLLVFNKVMRVSCTNNRSKNWWHNTIVGEHRTKPIHRTPMAKSFLNLFRGRGATFFHSIPASAFLFHQ